ncbi:hypothetical protein HU47_25775 [Salmonella enterica subsp. enterica serovar Abaetetuba]|nr:hypothetical protein [Salmonella enterica subsp. enterica serovar Pomona]EAM2006141.1 hypothetical protein [Salmonella enterica subsp. enterica serovar Give]EAR0467327.1 hypothetical protein [Salmonella enterica subsp. enterica serovar Poona]EAS6933960.1 hypothetical protein [Salmonella enterica subsp. enterica serovar Oranienburg]EBV5808188.1 hypothetical protein [Salmonella enterica subsp. enterica serovar Abaetetuba]
MNERKPKARYIVGIPYRAPLGKGKITYAKTTFWAAFGKRTILYGCVMAVGCTPALYRVWRVFWLIG